MGTEAYAPGKAESSPTLHPVPVGTSTKKAVAVILCF